MEDRLRSAEILEEAADLYRSETVDWCQGSWIEHQGEEAEFVSVCAEGALLLAAGFSFEEIQILSDTGVSNWVKNMDWNHARTRLHIHLNTSVFGWNDRRERTKQDVIDAMEATAKDLRNG
jgi:hypothetical protein